MRTSLTVIRQLALLMVSASLLSAQTSSWVFAGSDGHLHYRTDSQGNRVMDFSWAGYKGGGVPLPTVAVQQTLSPSGGDDTSAIQSAINTVSALALDGNGFRGAVLLAPGTFNISAQLNINASGVVLRGSGSGSGGTTINMTGTASFRAINVAGSGSRTTSTTANITDSYVPSGTNTINVDNASGFTVGDTVVINRVATSAWIHFMGMDTLVRGGVPQTWIAVGSVFHTDRIITAISGNTITVDAPITDSFDSAFLGTPAGTISKYAWPTRISQSGVEHLRVLAPIGTTIYSAIAMDIIIDGWIQDVVGQETQNAFDINTNAKQVTVDRVINNVSTTQTRSAGTADFSITGTEVFANQCQSNGTGDWPIITAAMGTGPASVLNFSSTQAAGISPHQRWYTGLLADNSSFPNAPSGTPGVAYRDRGTAGSGQGWTVGWAVAWNVDTPFLLVQEPPGVNNWCLGCVGTEVSASEPGGNGTLLPNGIFESTGTHVTPASLYLAQLCDRLGPAALTNIGYSTSFCVQGTPDFSIAATPATQTVTAGGGTSYTATVTASGGFTSTVNLSVSGLPSGAAGTFNPASITGGSGSSTLSVSTSASTPAGTYTLTITGTSSSPSLTHSTTVTLVVNAPPDFTIMATPSSQTVIQGGSTSYTASVSPLNGFASTVNLSVSGLPNGASGTFSPTSISGGSGSSTLSVSTSASTPTGTFTLTITGTSSSPSLTHSTTVTLVVNPPPPPDFTIAATPGSQTVTQGGSTSYTASVSPLNGFTGTVNLSATVSGSPAGVSTGFNPASISGGSGSSTLSVSTTSATPVGTYTITITGTSGSLSHATNVTLVVNPSTTLPPGWSDTDIGSPGVAGSATFSSGTFTVNGSGADIWSTADHFNYAYESLTGDVTVTARVASQQNTNLWAKSGVMIRESTAANASFVHVFVTPGHGVNMQYRNGTGASAVQLAALAGPVAPEWVRLVRSGSTFTGFASADGVIWTQVGTISVTMASNALEGLAVTAHNNTALNTSTFDNVTVSTPAPDFSISATPGSQTVTVGSGTSYTATVTPVNGFSSTVNLSATVSGSPAGVSTSFNPASISGGSGSSTLSVSTTGATPAGTYTITITGSDGGSLSHSTTVTLIVNSSCVSGSAGDGWHNTALAAAQTGTFTAQYDATPSASPLNAVVGLSQGAQTAYTGFATLTRFNPSGDIDARNGGAYAAASTIPFSAGVTYHFRLVINVPTHTYSIFVTPAGGTEQTVGTNFAFRSEQSGVTALDWWGLDVNVSNAGSLTTCNFTTQ